MTRGDDLRPGGGHLPPYCRHDATRRTGDNDEGHDETTSTRIVGEPSLCPQCQHGQHYSTMHAMPRRGNKIMTTTAMTMPRCTTTRQDGLPTKLLASTPLGLSTARVGRTHLPTCNLAPELYMRGARPLLQGTDSGDFIQTFVHLTPPTSSP
jgi:hypothetical protein